MEVNEVYNQIEDEQLIKLVDIFYSKVVNHPHISHMFDEDTSENKKFQYLFLKYIFGGGGEYRQLRGHPRLRERHFPFKIGWKERVAWLEVMGKSLDLIGFNSKVRATIDHYFDHMASKIINQKDDRLISL